MARPQPQAEVLTESVRVNSTEVEATLRGGELAWRPAGGGNGEGQERRLELESEVLGCRVDGRKLKFATFAASGGDNGKGEEGPRIGGEGGRGGDGGRGCRGAVGERHQGIASPRSFNRVVGVLAFPGRLVLDRVGGGSCVMRGGLEEFVDSIG
ncbi:unnamed protein product [Miscanthus lutarioriparius]|uniref:Uncharacterized protein n=1 Tax=Miscanthus lutarioriparius TaxID=422564 RepID=A0A811N982_9POAL|nr:unnamed protein product [Miscanthus lutarioriparius]